MIRSYIRYWPVVGGIIFALMAITLGIFADSIPALQRLMILFFMILTLHEFEEYVYPGGFLQQKTVLWERQRITANTR